MLSRQFGDCFRYFATFDNSPAKSISRGRRSSLLALIMAVALTECVEGFMFACDAETMTLESALASAYTSNPQLDAQRAALRATDEEVAKALGGWRPTVGVSGAYGWQRDSETLLGAQPQVSTPQSDQLTITQSVFNGQTLPSVHHAKALVDAGRDQLLVTEQTVLLNAASAYFAVVRDMQVVKAYQDDIQHLREILANSRQRLKLGDLTKTDASQASARLLGSQLSLGSAEQQLASDRAAFEHVVGRPAEALADHDVPPLPDEVKSLDIALAENPSLLQARAQAQAADYAVDTAFGALMPKLTVQAQYGRTIDEVAPGVRENGLSVIGQLSIPLYQGGAEEAGVREAKEQSSQATYIVFNAERQVREDLRNAWKAFATADDATGLANRQIVENATAYQGSIMESQVGARTTIDILNADQELLQSNVAAISARENKIVAAYQVLSALGRLTAKDLKLPITLYNPQAHYDEDATRWFGFGN